MSLMPFLHQPVETTTLKDFYSVTQWKEKKPLPIIGGMHVLVDQATGPACGEKSRYQGWPCLSSDKEPTITRARKYAL